MASCPKCKRDSLEYSELRSAAWCLYAECAFSERVHGYDDYVNKFESSAIATSKDQASRFSLQ